MSENENNSVDAVKVIRVLQDKLRVKDDENTMLQARILMLDEKVESLFNQLNPAVQDTHTNDDPKEDE